MKLISRVGRSASQYMLIATMTSLLVACGSGDTAESAPDLDSDGIIDSEDDDDDGDLIPDIDDLFTDRDGDGFDDVSGFTEAEAYPPLGPADADGDGFVDVTDTTPCGSESGTDNASANNTWNDNCLVERSSIGGQFADSLYSVGIQRVIYCEGFGAGASYTNFADGEFGPNSEAALQEFQRRELLTDDGKVGPQTWARLQAQIEMLDEGTFDSTGSARDTWGFSEGRCAGIPMFYQQVQSGQDSENTDLLGWSLARNLPNQTDTLPFSIGSPFIGL